VERSLVIIKPDGVQRGLVGLILGRLEARGLQLIALKLMQMPRELAERHYEAHRGKGFFEPTVAYMTSAPVVVAVFEGPRAISVIRTTMGATNAAEAAPGTIRGDYALEISRNLIHGSDGPESAVREVSLFFRPEELVSYTRDVQRWITE
jgi:nucleoside-diphosphate kinase